MRTRGNVTYVQGKPQSVETNPQKMQMLEVVSFERTLKSY